MHTRKIFRRCSSVWWMCRRMLCALMIKIENLTKNMICRKMIHAGRQRQHEQLQSTWSPKTSSLRSKMCCCSYQRGYKSLRIAYGPEWKGSMQSDLTRLQEEASSTCCDCSSKDCHAHRSNRVSDTLLPSWQ